MRPVDRFTCDETFRRLNDYLDRELSPPEMRQVQAHLDVCAFCAAEFAFEAQALEGIRSKLRRIRVPQGMLDRLRDALARGWEGTTAAGASKRRARPGKPPSASKRGQGKKARKRR